MKKIIFLYAKEKTNNNRILIQSCSEEMENQSVSSSYKNEYFQ